MKLPILIAWASLVLSLPLAAAEYQYGMVSLIESRISAGKKQEKELIIRADLYSGNEFFCKERVDDSRPSKADALWLRCIGKLIEKTPGAKLSDVPGNAVYYEPVVLTIFGKQGWEIYDVEQNILDNSVVYSVTKTFRVRRLVAK